MLTICLTRIGKKNQPQFRLIVKDRRSDPWGKAIEILGFTNPRVKPRIFEFKKDRVEYWLSVGAQPSGTVKNLLIDEGILPKDTKKAKTIKISKKRREKMDKEKTLS